MNTNNELIGSIVDMEEEMFQAVPVAARTACQESSRDSFRLLRECMFVTWSEKTLRSYHNDLKRAVDSGENVMTQKYALMDNLILPLSYNPLIEDIVKIEEAWIAELSERYPSLVGMGRTSEHCVGDGSESGVTYDVYRRSELQTCSDATLDYLYEDISRARREARNLSEETYASIYSGLGYSSLEEAENTMRKTNS